ncbi:hypothetical protein SMICM17S_12959 [Streptomyces microflavus]
MMNRQILVSFSLATEASYAWSSAASEQNV